MAGKVLVKTKVKPVGINLLLWVLVAFIVMNLLARFNIVDLTPWQPDILTGAAILFVSLELGLMQFLRGKKKLDPLSWFGVVVVVLAGLGLVAGWFGMTLGFLEGFKGTIDLLLLVYVIIEIFR